MNGGDCHGKAGGGGGRGYPSSASEYLTSYSTSAANSSDGTFSGWRGSYGDANGTGGKCVVFYRLKKGA
jgi:hypothetical protein